MLGDGDYLRVAAPSTGSWPGGTSRPGTTRSSTGRRQRPADRPAQPPGTDGVPRARGWAARCHRRACPSRRSTSISSRGSTTRSATSPATPTSARCPAGPAGPRGRTVGPVRGRRVLLRFRRRPPSRGSRAASGFAGRLSGTRSGTRRASTRSPSASASGSVGPDQAVVVDLLARADEKLYEAKRAGRNRVRATGRRRERRGLCCGAGVPPASPSHFRERRASCAANAMQAGRPHHNKDEPLTPPRKPRPPRPASGSVR